MNTMVLYIDLYGYFRLMVNLTQPAKLCFQNSIPEDKTTRNYYLEVESHLQAYKEVCVYLATKITSIAFIEGYYHMSVLLSSKWPCR